MLQFLLLHSGAVFFADRDPSHRHVLSHHARRRWRQRGQSKRGHGHSRTSHRHRPRRQSIQDLVATACDGLDYVRHPGNTQLAADTMSPVSLKRCLTNASMCLESYSIGVLRLPPSGCVWQRCAECSRHLTVALCDRRGVGDLRNPSAPHAAQSWHGPGSRGSRYSGMMLSPPLLLALNFRVALARPLEGI